MAQSKLKKVTIYTGNHSEIWEVENNEVTNISITTELKLVVVEWIDRALTYNGFPFIAEFVKSDIDVVATPKIIFPR